MTYDHPLHSVNSPTIHNVHASRNRDPNLPPSSTTEQQVQASKKHRLAAQTPESHHNQ